MIRAISDDAGFAESAARGIEERNIIDHLMAQRTKLGMSQKDIAGKMKCTQSRISKLENGKDDDLRIGDFHGYADALGHRLMIVLAKKGRPPIADRIKYHTTALKQLVAELSELVGDDEVMRKGMVNTVLRTTGDLALALAEVFKQAAQKMPQANGNAIQAIQVQIQEDDSGEESAIETASQNESPTETIAR